MVTFYTLAAIVAFVWNLIPKGVYVSDLSVCLYCAAIIAWALTIQKRILQKNIRRILQIGAFLLGALFTMQLCQVEFFPGNAAVREVMHCGYHVCFMIVSQLAMMAALCVGRDEQERPLRLANFLWIPQAVCCIVILTNPLHQQMFAFSDLEGGIYTYRWFYYLTIICEIVFCFATFLILLYRCRVSAVRKRWFVPAFFISFGVALMILYLICNGPPKLFGVELYHMQEAFSFLFISSFESMIRIGLIPSNTNYEEFFYRSDINAVIYDDQHTELYTSLGYREFREENNRVCTKAIRGGTVLWLEDVGTIYRLNDELRRATEEVEEENDLILQENDLRMERIGYETRNRLYDRIAMIVRPQSNTIDALLNDPDENNLKDNMLYAVVLGAYIKRIGNLLLIADGQEMISTAELSLSIGETFEYLRLSGYACDLVSEEDGEVRSDAITASYRLFEHVIETSYQKMHACFVTISTRDVFALQIALDVPNIGITQDLSNLVKQADLSLQTWVEDNTAYVKLEAKESLPDRTGQEREEVA